MAHDSDSSAASAALRGASLAFSHQKQQKQQQQQQQQLSAPIPTRAPSVSPSRPPHSSSYNSYTSSSSAISSSLNQHDTGRSTVSNNALLAANVASLTGSTRSIPTVNTPQQSQQSQQSQHQLLRPSSPMRSPSPGRAATAAARTSHSRSPSRPLPPSSSVASLGPPVSTLSASFLAATRAASRTASQAASPGLTPSHTGHETIGSSGTVGSSSGAPPAHLSAALSASAAGDERRRAAAAAVAANSTATSRSTDSLGRFSAAYTGNSHSTSSLALTATSNPDTSAIPPTSSLIHMFEESTTETPKPKPKPKKPKPKATAVEQGQPPTNTRPLKAFTPPRSVSPTKEDPDEAKDMQQTPKAVARAKPKPISKPKQAESVPTPEPKPNPKTDEPPKAERTGPAKPQKLEKSSTGNALRQHRLPLRSLNDDADVMERPSPMPIQAPTPPRPRARDPSVASSVSAVSAASMAHSTANSTATSSSSVGRATSTVSYRSRRASISGAPTPPAPRRTATAVDGLASAIMAGSLAAAAATKMSPQPTSSSATSRPPSPPKRTTTMLHTLRRDRSPHSEDDDEIYESHYKRSHYHRDGRLRQGKLHFSHATGTAARNKHQHHHEGARKRWREAITERQRRRYEAVWASNRGQHGLQTDLDYKLDNEMVPNIVVRDIWRRSRLPADELAEVWDLVDDTGSGGLSKIGFVVGLWLIDQRLRGRKIPARVSESVWSSARGMQPKRR